MRFRGKERLIPVPHPRFTTALRWWIADLPVGRMLATGLGGLLVYAMLGSAVYVATSEEPTSIGSRFSHGHRDLDTVLAMLRATLGDPMSVQDDNTGQQLLADVTSLIGVLIPAIVIGVVFIRLFSISPFVWRSKVSICKASECDLEQYAKANGPREHGMMTVRFYNRFTNLAIADMTARVYLHYIAPSVDHSDVFHKVAVRQLDGKGDLTLERVWPSAEQGAPFTVWIPLDCPVPPAPKSPDTPPDLVHLQDSEIGDKSEVKLLIRITGKVIGLGTDIIEERWYRLRGRDSEVELGRFVPVKPATDRHVRDWKGWDQFEEVLPAGVADEEGPRFGAEAQAVTEP